jgi:hypothetical protein
MNALKNPKMDHISIFSQTKHIYLTVTDRCYRAEHLLSLTMDGQLSKRLTNEIEKHLDTCASCRAAKAIMLATHEALSRREAVLPPAYLSERLRQAIAMEAAKPTVTKPRAFVPAHRLLLAGTSAAAVVVLSLLLFHHNSAPNMTTPNKTAVNVANSGVSPKHSAENRQIITPSISPHPYFVAVLPQSVDNESESLHLSLPVRVVAKQYIGRHTQASAGASLYFRASPLVKLTSHAQPPRSSTSEPMIANLPRPVAPSTTSPIEQTAQVSPLTTPARAAESVDVADNTDLQVHGNLYTRLRLSSLNASGSEDSFVQPDQSHIRLTSYLPPGAQLEGSKIDN